MKWFKSSIFIQYSPLNFCSVLTLCLLAIAFNDSIASLVAEEISVILPLSLGNSTVRAFEEELERIAIGDPQVLSVVTISKREILLSPKKIGRTNLMLWFKSGRREFAIQVEQDLSPLRDHLSRLHDSIRLETTADGTILLVGEVPTYETMRAAVDVAARFLDGTRSEAATGVVIESGKSKPTEDRKNDSEESASFVEKSRAVTSPKLRNLLVVRELPQTLQDRMQEVARSFGGDLRIRWLQAGDREEQTPDTYILEGHIESPSDYLQLLTVLDSLIGGTGRNLKGHALGANGINRPLVHLTSANGSRKLLGMAKIRQTPQSIEERLREIVRSYSLDLRISRIPRRTSTLAPDELILRKQTRQNEEQSMTTELVVPPFAKEQTEFSPDTFVLDSSNDREDIFLVQGTIANQSAYMKLLTQLDATLGGDGKFDVSADHSGALTGNFQRAGSRSDVGSRSSGTGRSTNSQRSSSRSAGLQADGFDNLQANPGRGLVVRGGSGRLLSFVRVAELPQVMVAVRVIDYERNKLKDVGANLRMIVADYRVDDPFPLLNTPPSPMLPASARPNAQNVANVINGLTSNQFAFLDSRFSVDLTIRMLESRGLVRTLSEPNILTLSGEEAEFLVGTVLTVPETVETVTTDTQTITQRRFREEEYGVRLRIRPIVDEYGTITLTVLPLISELRDATAELRTSQERSLKTTVRLKSGQGLVLGGLISLEKIDSEQRPPVLGRIPGLGQLLTRKVRTERDRELAFILTPQIVDPVSNLHFARDLPEREHKPLPGSYVQTSEETLYRDLPRQNLAQIVPLEGTDSTEDLIRRTDEFWGSEVLVDKLERLVLEDRAGWVAFIEEKEREFVRWRIEHSSNVDAERFWSQHYKKMSIPRTKSALRQYLFLVVRYRQVVGVSPPGLDLTIVKYGQVLSAATSLNALIELMATRLDLNEGTP